MAGPNGGARPGAGRKRKVDKNVTAIDKAERQIRDRLPAIIDHVMALACGVKVQVMNEDGEVEFYTQAPDRESCKYLIDRIMGKPDVRVKAEHSGTVAWISRAQQLEALADPMALELLCELDARLSTAPYPGDDGSPLGAPGVAG